MPIGSEQFWWNCLPTGAENRKNPHKKSPTAFRLNTVGLAWFVFGAKNTPHKNYSPIWVQSLCGVDNFLLRIASVSHNLYSAVQFGLTVGYCLCPQTEYVFIVVLLNCLLLLYLMSPL